MDTTTESLLKKYRSSFDNDSQTQCSEFRDEDGDSEAALEKAEVQPSRRGEKGRRQAVVWAYSFAILLVVVTFCALVIYIFGNVPTLRVSRVPPEPRIQWKSCGNTSEEARDRGCALDLIDRTWVPKECFDEEMAEEFLGKEDWHWYTSETGDSEVSQEDIRRGEGPDPVWVSDEYHWVHCQYTWLKLHRAVLKQKPMAKSLSRYKHTLHCAKDLALHFAEPHGRAQFTLGFTSCPVRV